MEAGTYAWQILLAAAVGCNSAFRAARHRGRAPRGRRTARWASVPCRCFLNRWARPFPFTVAQDRLPADPGLSVLVRLGAAAGTNVHVRSCHSARVATDVSRSKRTCTCVSTSGLVVHKSGSSARRCPQICCCPTRLGLAYASCRHGIQEIDTQEFSTRKVFTGSSRPAATSAGPAQNPAT